MNGYFQKKIKLFLMLIVTSIVLSGCGLPRNPVPIARISDGSVVGFPGVRYWEVQYNPDVKIDSSDPDDCSFLVPKGHLGRAF
jgi:hypothetical protein